MINKVGCAAHKALAQRANMSMEAFAVQYELFKTAWNAVANGLSFLVSDGLSPDAPF